MPHEKLYINKLDDVFEDRANYYKQFEAKYKYLGRYYIEYKDFGNEEQDPVLIPIDEDFIDTNDYCNWFSLNLFMKQNQFATLHAISSESNTSSIGLIMDKSNDTGRLWRIS